MQWHFYFIFTNYNYVFSKVWVKLGPKASNRIITSIKIVKIDNNQVAKIEGLENLSLWQKL